LSRRGGRAWEVSRVADKVAALDRAFATLRPADSRSSPSCEPQGKTVRPMRAAIEPPAALATLQPKGRVPEGKGGGTGSLWRKNDTLTEM
jgi:hypothetical protein